MDKIYGSTAYCAWLREQARMRRPYWYGTCFQPCTEDLLKRKTAQYPSEYTNGRMSRYRADIAAGQICADCVGGAIKGAAWTMLSTEKWVYASHGVQDRSADGMFEWCKALGAAHGKIADIPERPGIAVRKAGHVGVYVGNGEVVEWRGFAYGCVVTKLKDRPWTDWYELPWVTYAADDTAKPVRRTLKYGCKGEDVKALQERLIELGYGSLLGKDGADGDFGRATESAVEAFQDDNGLEKDGVVGPKTWAALDAATSPPRYTVTIRGLMKTEADRIAADWPGAEVKPE